MIDVLRSPPPGLALSLALTLVLGMLDGTASSAAGEDAPAAVASIEHPVVPGFERFHADPGSDAIAGGLILLGELNCTSCHAAGAEIDGQVLRKQAPILDSVGSRVRPSYLRAFLSDPHAVKPGTTMPHLLGTTPAEEKSATVDALVHFLASYGRIAEKGVDPRAIPNGKKLYHEIGCVACHGRRDPSGSSLAASMPLGDLASKYTIPSLTAFLQDPLKVRPSGRMPALNLVKKEANELACYLLEDLKGQSRPNLEYSYYEGEWQSLPDFDSLTPKATGEACGFDVSVAKRPGRMALRFEGFFHNKAAGEYTFHLTSDDGSKLFIDGALVVDNDGLHAPETRTGKVELIKGSHKFVVGVFNATNETELDVEYEGRGLERQSALTAITRTRDMPEAETDDAATATAGGENFRVNHDLAEKGRAEFARLGCASCHQLRAGIATIASTLTAPPLSGLPARPDGCLAPEHASGGRMYDLGARQRDALIAAIRALREGTLPASTPRTVVARTMTAFNCYACHVRDGRGGVEEARQASFKTTQPEMGDEGRIPPSLDGVGAKLQVDYLKRYFDVGVKDRPSMLTRMPRFGASNLGKLGEAFAALDPLEAVEVPTFDDSPRRVKSVGRFLCGGQALGCIKCHNFNGVKAEGVQAVDMTVMTRRLRHDWFHRYLVDTQAYRPGTRMPTAWPGGKTMLPQVLDGDTPRQIEAVWQFLSDGRDAAEPYGLGREPLPLLPGSEAIIYRNFLKGAGPRAIGVGYPERASLAFDANDLRIALIWQGAFIDAARHWSGRGNGFQAPLGDNVLELPEGPSFAMLSNSDELWPQGPAKERGDAFRGYRLTKDGRPTFLYDVGPVHVTDFPEAVTGPNPNAASFRRTLTLDGPSPPRSLWFRAIAADKVEPIGDGWYRIDDEWKMRIDADADAEPLLRKSAGKTELLVPLKRAGDRESRIVQEFVW
jgi:mono/diheme cytochrome c family protein